MNRNVALFTGIGLGVGLMYVLDPAAGRRRRAVARDKMFSWWRTGSSALDKASRDISNRTRGLMAEMGSKSDVDVSDSRLEGRVRSRIGHVVSHPSAVTATVSAGRVVLTGDVFKSELNNLLTALANVPGVMTTENNLRAHDTAENVPALQGPARERRSSVNPRSWTPTAWAVIGAAGGGVGAYYGIRYAVASRKHTPWWRRAMNPARWPRAMNPARLRRVMNRVDWQGAVDRVSMPSYDFTRLIRWSPESRILAGAAGGTMAYYLTRAIWNGRAPRTRWQRIMSSMPRVNAVAERLQIPSWRMPKAVAQQVNRWVH